LADDNSAMTFRDAQFIDNRILEVKNDLLTEIRELREEIQLLSSRQYDMNREVGGLKVRVGMISGVVGAASGLLTALATKFGLH